MLIIHPELLKLISLIQVKLSNNLCISKNVGFVKNFDMEIKLLTYN